MLKIRILSLSPDIKKQKVGWSRSSMKTLANISTKSKRPISRSCNLPDVQFVNARINDLNMKNDTRFCFSLDTLSELHFRNTNIIKIRYNNARKAIFVSKLCFRTDR